MKTLKILGLIGIMLFTFQNLSAQSKWKWENRSSTVKPTLTEINYLQGVTDTIQKQLNKRYTAAQADALFTKIADGWQLRDSIYFESEVDSITNLHDYAKVLRLMGSTVKGFPVAQPIPTNANNYAFTDNTLYGVSIYVDKASTITGLRWGSTATASFTADNFNGVALFSIALDGTYTRIAVSANSGNNFNAANGGLQSVAFTSPVNVQAGVYFAAVLYNSSATTTAPQTYGGAVVGLVSQYALGLSSGWALAGTLATQNDMPTSFSGTSLTRVANVAQIYPY